MTGLFTANSDNAMATLYALVQSLKVKVTRNTVRNELSMHPDFPSILSMSDMLTDWKVDNAALQLKSVEQLRELPLPFIAHLRRNNGWYVLVSGLRGDAITYSENGKGRTVGLTTDFEQQWSGVVLVAEAEEHSGETSYAANRKQEILRNLRGPFVLVSSLLISSFVILRVADNLTAIDWLLILTKVIGLVLSGLLIVKQLGHHNAFSDRFCQLNRKINCDSVLNSPGAKLWGWLSWTDVGLIYFAGGLLTIFLIGNQPNDGPATIRPLFYGLGLLALPYTIFSVYYQASVIRQWCALCLMVQGVLLTEGLLSLTQLSPLSDDWHPYATTLIVFLVPTLAWVLFRPLLTNAAQNLREHDELVRFKRNPDMFQALLLQQPKMPPVPNDLHPIVLGNLKAKHTITMVANPYCEPCARKHQELEEIVSSNSDVKVQIVFTCDGREGPNTQAAVHMMAMNQNGPAQKALTSWYKQSNRNYERWAVEFPVDYSSIDWQSSIQYNKRWLEMANINVTPTLFIDGYKQPNLHSMADAVKMMSYLSSRQPVGHPL